MAEVGALSGRVSPACAGPIRPITGRPSLAPPFLYPLRHALPCGRDTTALRRWGGWGLPCCPMWRGGWGGGASPFCQCGEADGEVASYSPAGLCATVVGAGSRRANPRALLAPACQHLWPVADDGP